jgi:hypothetical protein
MFFSGLARFFWVGSVFSGLAWFFFFSSLGSIQFFRFQAYKIETEPNRTEPVGCLKILIGLIGFFSWFCFFDYFFWFSRFNWFFDFFAHPYHKNTLSESKKGFPLKLASN